MSAWKSRVGPRVQCTFATPENALLQEAAKGSEDGEGGKRPPTSQSVSDVLAASRVGQAKEDTKAQDEAENCSCAHHQAALFQVMRI